MSKKPHKVARASDGEEALPNTRGVKVGVVGLGLMGSSITTCLLASGHSVAGVELDEAKCRSASRRILSHLHEMKAEGLLKANPRQVANRLEVSQDPSILEGSEIVIEAIIENLPAKRQVIGNAEKFVSPSAIIASNTSSLPLTELQKGARHPERILGMHWGEPAHTNRFMEVIFGDQTDPKVGERAALWGRRWGKEPAVLRRDIRGFITNRCFYALLREAFHLVDAGYCTVADVDRSLRNDLGSWITFAGPFRYLDLTGLPAYQAVMQDLFPDLECSQNVPRLMRQVVESGALGVANAKGFYSYTPQEAKRWERLFRKFSFEIRELAQRYPEDAGRRGKA